MPVYEFKCGDCGQVFEVMGTYEERPRKGPLYGWGGVRRPGGRMPASSDAAPGPGCG